MRSSFPPPPLNKGMPHSAPLRRPPAALSRDACEPRPRVGRTMKNSILIVDDEATLVEAIRDHFVADGFDAIPARSGEEALRLARTRDFDVIVSDLKMPGLDGIGLLRALGELPQMPSVILMTAYGTMEYAIEAFRLGLFDFLQKPISLDELSRTVERALAACAVNVEPASLPIPLRVLCEHSRRVGRVRAEVAGDPADADATAVWRLRSLGRNRVGFVWAHVVPQSRSALGARLIIKTLSGVVDLGAPAEALHTIMGHLREFDCASTLRALAVGVAESEPRRRLYGAAHGPAGLFRLGAGDSEIESLSEGAQNRSIAWETTLAPEDVLLLADPHVVSAAGERWPDILSTTAHLVSVGEPNPARRALAMLPGATPASVMVALRLGETIQPEGTTHLRVSSSWACLEHLRDVTEQFAVSSSLSERAAYEFVAAAQEAILNSIRWAYPGRQGAIALTLERTGGRVRASLRDEGVGFDVGETFRRLVDPSRDPLRRSGRGLMLMRGLADDFEITSKPDRGTRVILTKIIGAPSAGGAASNEVEDA